MRHSRSEPNSILRAASSCCRDRRRNIARRTEFVQRPPFSYPVPRILFWIRAILPPGRCAYKVCVAKSTPMILTCPAVPPVFVIARARSSGRTVRCAHCGQSWYQMAPRRCRAPRVPLEEPWAIWAARHNCGVGAAARLSRGMIILAAPPLHLLTGIAGVLAPTGSLRLVALDGTSLCLGGAHRRAPASASNCAR